MGDTLTMQSELPVGAGGGQNQPTLTGSHVQAGRVCWESGLTGADVLTVPGAHHVLGVACCGRCVSCYREIAPGGPAPTLAPPREARG